MYGLEHVYGEIFSSTWRCTLGGLRTTPAKGRSRPQTAASLRRALRGGCIMDTSTLDLYQLLQSGPFDEAGLHQVKRLLGGHRRLLRSKNDHEALEQLITTLEDWAAAAGGGWLSASALAEAAEIAEIDLRDIAHAEQLRSQAIVTGRAASGMPAPVSESVAMEGAIDANAELLHELKTLPPGALTQTFVTDDAPLEATEELDVEALRESSIPQPQFVPAPAPTPSLRSEPKARRPSTLHGYIAPQHEDSFSVSQVSQVNHASSQRSEGSRGTSVRDQPSSSERSSPLAAQGGENASQDDALFPEPQSAPFAADGGTRESQVDASSFAGQDGERASTTEARSPDRRSTPVPTLLGETPAQSDFPARLRSTPPAALRAVTEPRRSSNVPSQPRASGGGAAAASQALRPAVSTQPIRLTPLPQLSLNEQPAANAPEEHTQEVHTIDLELRPTMSVPPFEAAEPANDDALSAQIAAAERSLDSDASPDRVRELAELYVKRDAQGDRAQAADLYCTLGEVLGNPGGVAMLDRALALAPDHAEAKALLTRYAVRPRMPISSPKITVLGLPPKLSVPQPPPPAAAAGLRPTAAGSSLSGAGLPPPAAGSAQRAPAGPPPRASVAPGSVQAGARARSSGAGPMHDVLSLHGVPQVVTTPPAVPQISSLTPIVRSDASELQARRLSFAKHSYVALGGIALSAAAALAIYISVRGPSNDNAPLARPSVASESTGQTAAASQPMAKAPELQQPAAPQAPAAAAAAAVAAAAKAAESAGKPAPLAPPGPSHLPLLKLESAQLRGGKLSATQLTAALGKAQPKLLACFEQAIEKKPRMKGRVIYGFTVRTNGRATNIKRVGGTLKDETLLQCSVKVLETVRFPKPRKSAQVKLPIQYKRT